MHGQNHIKKFFDFALLVSFQKKKSCIVICSSLTDAVI